MIQFFIVALGTLSTTFAMIALSVILNGWAFWLLWMWFVTPVFPTLVLSLGQAIGLGMLVGFATTQYTDTDPDYKFWIYFFLNPILYISVGFIVKSFI